MEVNPTLRVTYTWKGPCVRGIALIERSVCEIMDVAMMYVVSVGRYENT